jgi:predicted transcriptional regulator YdeE
MEKYNFQNDLKLLGIRVKTFPLGIKEAFDELARALPKGEAQPFYGISECTKDGIIYIAAALETFEGEGEKYGYETFTVEKGEYLSVTLFNWMTKTDSIKNVFEEMFKDERSDTSKPCVELYQTDDEMRCLVKIDPLKV